MKIVVAPMSALAGAAALGLVLIATGATQGHGPVRVRIVDPVEVVGISPSAPFGSPSKFSSKSVFASETGAAARTAAFGVQTKAAAKSAPQAISNESVLRK